MDAGDIAAIFAAVAAVGALGVSLWSATYTSREARRLERVKWVRTQIIEDVTKALRSVRAFESALWDDDPQAITDLSKSALDDLGLVEIKGSTALSEAAMRLGAVLIGTQRMWELRRKRPHLPDRSSSEWLEQQHELTETFEKCLADFRTVARKELDIY